MKDCDNTPEKLFTLDSAFDDAVNNDCLEFLCELTGISSTELYLISRDAAHDITPKEKFILASALTDMGYEFTPDAAKKIFSYNKPALQQL